MPEEWNITSSAPFVYVAVLYKWNSLSHQETVAVGLIVETLNPTGTFVYTSQGSQRAMLNTRDSDDQSGNLMAINNSLQQ